jgi:transcriptional regulator with XRE-family HTH domain
MGTTARRKPKHLAEKLIAVRKALGDSQNSLIRRLGLTNQLTQSDISAFERGTREPPLYVLLRYSELSRVWVNAFIDDNVALPENLPSSRMHEGVKHLQHAQNKGGKIKHSICSSKN